MLDELKKLDNAQLEEAYRKLASLSKSEEKGLLEKKSRFNAMFKANMERKQTDVQTGKTMIQLAAENAAGINEVIWPFWFSSVKARVLQSNNARSDITITQEAPFILVSMVKSLYTLANAGLVNETITYIDPNNIAAPVASGLNITFLNSQSKQYLFDQPIPVDHLGHAEKPYILDSPYMFLPNSNMEINFSNTNTTTDYFVIITFFGYRMRLQNADNMLGLVTEY